jgi:hypothetical protein
MEKLNKRETIKAEAYEARRAKDKLDIQRLQYDKRLYYIPNILRVVIAVAFIMLLLLVSFRYWSEQVKSITYVTIVEEDLACPVALPPTWAYVN